MGIGAGRSHGEFVHVRCAKDDGSGSAQSLDDDRILRGCGLGCTDGRARERNDTGDVAEIFYADRDAFERTARLGALSTRVALVGGGTRFIGEYPNEGPRAFTVRVRDSRERLLREVSTGRATGGKLAVELSKSWIGHRGANLPPCD